MVRFPGLNVVIIAHLLLTFHTVCCTFGSGGPVELFQGSTEDGELLFSEPFQGVDRLVRSFVIVGSENSASFGRSLVSAIVVPLFVAWFSFF